MKSAAFLDRVQTALPGEVLERVAAGMAQVEDALAQEVQSQVSTVASVGQATVRAGGKRLRPALMMLSAWASGGEADPRRLATLGACLEMIHMATLVHDDVIDVAETRRGHRTAASLHGNTAAVLSGDVLLAKAMRLLAHDGDLRVIRTVSDAVVEMAEGEVREVEARGRFDLEPAEHRAILRMKTAAFVECCCRVGGLVAGADERAIDDLARFGHHLGMAFQMIDDLLDWRGDEARTGKAIGIDFRDGQATSPLIDLRERLDPTEATYVGRKFGNGVTDDDLAMIARWMDDRGSFERVEQEAAGHVREAMGALERLPDGPFRDLLRAVADFILERDA